MKFYTGIVAFFIVVAPALAYGMEQSLEEGPSEATSASDVKYFDMNCLNCKKEAFAKVREKNIESLTSLLEKFNSEENNDTKKKIAHDCFSLAKDTFVVSTNSRDGIQAKDYKLYSSVLLSVMDSLETVQEPGHNPLLIATAALDSNLALPLLQKGADPRYSHHERARSAWQMISFRVQDQDMTGETKEKAWGLFKVLREHLKELQ
jgi:hypothetical protein